ncbi:chorismate mutase [Streptomyces sp. NPDC056682]|uniref:chorismate mutase n=1 Tax=Streptomyces sp. NPDC056682 TaxID=3345909 RepID=UPI00368B8D9F
MTDTNEAGARIEADRVAIDCLDVRIIDLLAERARISARIQQSRMHSGGPRMVFSREMDILSRYQDGLGADGTQIAMNVLKLCRGEAL